MRNENPTRILASLALYFLTACGSGGGSAPDADTTTTTDIVATDISQQDVPVQTDLSQTDVADSTDGVLTDMLPPEDTTSEDIIADVTPTSDGIETDATETSCVETGCPEGQFCYASQDICLNHCGDQATFEAALSDLDSDLKVMQSYCSTPGANYIVGEYGGVYEITPEDTAAGSQIRFSRWMLTEDGFSIPIDVTMFPLPAGLSFADFNVFLSPIFAVQDGQGKIAFGYTTGDVSGAVLVAHPPAGGVESNDPWTVTTISAQGNYGAAFANPSTLLINGLTALDLPADGVGSQGLYAVGLSADPMTSQLLVTNLGSASGNVLKSWGNWLVGGYAGFGTTWPDGGEGNRVFAIPGEDLLNALDTGVTLDAFNDTQLMDIPSDFTHAGEKRIVTKEIDGNWATVGLTLHQLDWDEAGQCSIESSQTLTTGSSFDAARDVPDSDAFLLRHASGYILVKGAQF